MTKELKDYNEALFKEFYDDDTAFDYSLFVLERAYRLKEELNKLKEYLKDPVFEFDTAGLNEKERLHFNQLLISGITVKIVYPLTQEEDEKET